MPENKDKEKYEAPKVEQVITREDMEDGRAYAGGTSPPPPPPP